MGGKGSGRKVQFDDEFHKVHREKVAACRARGNTGVQHQRYKKEEVAHAVQTFKQNMGESTLFQTLLKRRFPSSPKRRGGLQ